MPSSAMNAATGWKGAPAYQATLEHWSGRLPPVKLAPSTESISTESLAAETSTRVYDYMKCLKSRELSPWQLNSHTWGFTRSHNRSRRIVVHADGRPTTYPCRARTETSARSTLQVVSVAPRQACLRLEAQLDMGTTGAAACSLTIRCGRRADIHLHKNNHTIQSGKLGSLQTYRTGRKPCQLPRPPGGAAVSGTLLQTRGGGTPESLQLLRQVPPCLGRLVAAKLRYSASCRETNCRGERNLW
jgi:hypothetical protein